MGGFGIRMAAVFTISVTTAAKRAQLIPTWLVVIGYLFPLIQLFSPPNVSWVLALFPIWVFLLSVHILIATRRRGSDVDAWVVATQ